MNVLKNPIFVTMEGVNVDNYIIDVLQIVLVKADVNIIKITKKLWCKKGKKIWKINKIKQAVVGVKENVIIKDVIVKQEE